MRTICFSILVFYAAFVFAGNNDDVLVTIGNSKVTKDEFMKIFNRNRDVGDTSASQSPAEYLELFINYKLKVLEAKKIGLDTSPSLIKEFNGYRNQLAKPYMTDSVYIKQLMQRQYDRMQNEVRVSHIYLKLDRDATPEDTLNAYNRIWEFYKNINAGGSFDSIAKNYSDDVYTSKTNGDYGFISGFQLHYRFEDIIYSLKKDEMSEPFRSEWGYHIMKVTDIRKSPGMVKVAHIMLQAEEDLKKGINDTLKMRIDSIYNALLAGADFSLMASKYSDDYSSKDKGGELNWIKTGETVKEFEKAIFSLKNKGEFTKPVKTMFGWHIIKLVDKKDLPPFEEMKNEIQMKMQRFGFDKIIQDHFIDNLKKEYNFSYDASALSEFDKVIDSTLVKGSWNIDKANALSKTLVTINGETYSQNDFARYIAKNQSPRILSQSAILQEMFNLYSQNLIIEYEKENLKNKYPEFGAIINEYYDGMLLFEFMDKQVWSKAVSDTVGLEKFFEKNKTKYKWEQRVDVSVYTCLDSAKMDIVKKYAEERRTTGISADSVKVLVCDSIHRNCLRVEDEKYEKGDSKYADMVAWVPGEVKSITDKGKYIFIVVNGIVPPAQKTLKEALGYATSDYQKYLEDEMVKKLRSSYKITLNKDLLKTLK